MAATTQLPGRWYTTRNAFKTFYEGNLANVTTKDDLIDGWIVAVSEFIEQETNRIFIPWTGVKYFDYQGSRQIILGDDLLSVTTLTDDSGTLSSANYYLYPANAAAQNKPYTWIETDFSQEFFEYSDTKQRAIAITGKWGYSQRTRTLTTLAEDLDASETAVDLTSATNADYGMTILVDSEQMWISNISTNTVTVTRGMNGTTAATHTNTTTLYSVDPDPRVRKCCEILVARNMSRGDSAWADKVGAPGDAQFMYVKSIPAEAQAVLDSLRRRVLTPARVMA